jgi:hypothetical protein
LESETKVEEYENRFPTMKEIVNSGKLRPPPNESNSSVHVRTGHSPARTEATLRLPDVLKSADEFWNHRKEPPTLPQSVNNEMSSSFVVQTVLNTIMDPLSKILEFRIEDVLDIQPCISLLDTIPDLCLLGRNKIIASTVEVKKAPKSLRCGKISKDWNGVFGPNTAVAGEVFEQLYLLNINNLGSGGVGLLTTAKE